MKGLLYKQRVRFSDSKSYLHRRYLSKRLRSLNVYILKRKHSEKTPAKIGEKLVLSEETNTNKKEEIFEQHHTNDAGASIKSEEGDPKTMLQL